MDTRLYKAVTEGDAEMLRRLLLQHRPDPEDPTRRFLRSTTPKLNTALHLAALYGHANFAEQILAVDQELLVAQNGDGNTPLHLAAKAGKLEVAEVLIRHARDWPQERERPLSMTNGAGNNPLHEAVWNHRPDVAVALLEADPARRNDINYRMESPLHMAAREGILKVVKKIFEYSRDPEQQMLSQQSIPLSGTALHQAVLGTDLGILKILLEKLPDWTIDLTDSDGNNALHYAAQQDYPRMVEALLKKRGNLAYRRNNEQQSPLHVAACYGATKAIKAMLGRCPDVAEVVDGSGRNAFHASVASGKEDALRCLLQHARPTEMEELINRVDRNGDTPLHLAAKMNRIESVTMLLEDRHVDLCARDNDGQTARSIVEDKLHSGKTDMYLTRLLRKLQEQESTMCRKRLLPPTAPDKHMPLNNKEFDSVLDAYYIAATVVAAVSFAAAFTMPGGYDQTSGIALHSHHTAFKVFIVADAIAMCSSILVVFLLIRARKKPGVQLMVHYVTWSEWLIRMACIALLASLMTAVYISVAPTARWPAYAVIAIGVFSGFLFFIISWIGGDKLLFFVISWKGHKTQ
ncbi:unnamed protein product [Urochloa humidicola]